MTNFDSKRNQDEEPAQDEASSMVASAVGRQLKRMYNTVADDPVPDRFTELLAKLEGQEKSSK